MMSGFYGTIAVVFFNILDITSMQVIRRYRYQVFLFVHIISGTFFLLFVSMHWRLASQYLRPSVFYYFATQSPFLLQHSRKIINNYGLRITGVLDIPIPCRQSPENKEVEEETNEDDEAEESKPQQRSILARIFSPEPMDWLDEKVNRRGP
jgi:hypothetical protein